MISFYDEPVKFHKKFQINNEPHDDINIAKGDTFKVARNNERFWVIILGKASLIGKGKYFVRVDNDLVNRQPFECGDVLCLHKSRLFEKYEE